MKQYDENNIKKAIDKWEKTPADIGYTQSKMLNKLGLQKNPPLINKVLRIAAILAILLLSATVYSNLIARLQLDKDKQNLLLTQKEKEREISILKDSINVLSRSPKIEYRTVVKQIEKQQPISKSQNKSNEHIAQLQAENMSLKTSLESWSASNKQLTDSIKNLLHNMKIAEQEYQMAINDLKAKKSFDINFDQNLMASKLSNSTSTKTNNKDEKIQVKFGRRTPQTAPIRKSFSFR